MKFIFERLTTVKLFRGGIGIGPLNKKILLRNFHAKAILVVDLTVRVITVGRPNLRLSIVMAMCSKFLNLPFGVFIASKGFIFSKGDKMLVSSDTIDRELQARLLKETSDLYARKQKLEADIRSLDAVNNSLQGTAALRDIEAHRIQCPVSGKLG